MNRFLRISPLSVTLAAVLLAGIGLAATPALRVNGVKFGTNDNVLYVASCGAVGDGTTDDTSAIQTCITNAGANAKIKFSAANYLVTDTITIANAYVSLEGMGTEATRFTFNPASAKPLFKFSAGASVLFGARISDMSFFSTGANTQTKTAIQLVDTSGAIVENIDVDPLNRFSSTWKGTGSIGIQTKGREQTTIRKVNIDADKPIEISVDPNISTIGADHLHISDTFLAPTPASGGAAVTVDDGVVVMNLTIDGYNAWLVDKYGLFWSDTTSSTVGVNNRISGVRCEQHQDATGTSFYISATGGAAGIQNLMIEDFETSAGQNGILLRGINTATIRNGIFSTNDATKKHLDVASCFDLQLENNYVQDNTLTSVSGMTKLFELTRRSTAATMGPRVHWSAATTNPTTLDSVAELDLCPAATSCVIGSSSVAPNFPGGIGVSASKNIVGAGQMGLGSNGTVRYFLQTSGNMVPGASNLYNLGSSGALMATVYSQHYSGGGTAPAKAAGACIGGTQTVTLDANASDSAGIITMTGTASGTASATCATVTFASAYATAPHCQIAPANAAASALSGTAQLFVDSASTTTALFVIKVGSTALVAGTYLYAYDCTQ